MFGIVDDNPNNKWVIGKSTIHGDGVFVARRLRKGTQIGVGVRYLLGVFAIITSDFGSMINHSYNPTAQLRYSSDEGTWNVYALKVLPKGTEVTIDYSDTPWFIEGPMDWYT